MDNAILVSAALLIGALFGGFGAWFLASRPAADLRERLGLAEAASRDLETRLSEAVAKLSAAQLRAGQADALERERDEERTKRLALSERLAQVETSKAERERAFEEQKVALVEAREAMLSEFKATGAEVLKANQDEFLKRAEARFKESEATGEAKIKALLHPVGERLEKYEQQVETLEKQRVDAFGQLNGLIQSMREGQEQVRREAERLGNSLRNAPKLRGQWGEQQLRNLLEQCGLGEFTDFATEQSVASDDGRLRPDAIIRIPGNKLLIVDAKVSLNAYQDAFDAENENDREAALDKHVQSMRRHVQALSSKAYHAQFEQAPDYVIMFVPGEHYLNAAIEHDARQVQSKIGEDEALLKQNDLWNFALKQRVLLASPTNLIAIARTVAQVWRQDKIAGDAREIGVIGAELYSRLETAAQHLKRVGGGLESAVNNYNKFVGSFERNVLSSGKRLAEKGIEIGKREIEDVPLVEKKPRYNAADAAEVSSEFPLLGESDLGANDIEGSQDAAE
ncbi:MAG: DNA recombination protein RmuC [Pseudomonadota bacterium]